MLRSGMERLLNSGSVVRVTKAGASRNGMACPQQMITRQLQLPQGHPPSSGVAGGESFFKQSDSSLLEQHEGFEDVSDFLAEQQQSPEASSIWQAETANSMLEFTGATIAMAARTTMTLPANCNCASLDSKLRNALPIAGHAD